MSLSDESVEANFSRFIEEFRGSPELKYDAKLSELPVKGTRSLIIDFNDLYEWDDKLAQNIIDAPMRLFAVLESVLSSKLRVRSPEYMDQIKKVHIRFRNLPLETDLRSVGAENITHLIMVHGIIVRASSVQPLILKATFRCSACGGRIYLEQSGQILQKPQKCPDCDSRKGFELVPGESEYVDSQTITIQECPEDLPPGQLPRSLPVELTDDLVNIARPGDRVTITGVLVLLPKYGRGGELRKSEITVDTNYIEVSGRDLELLEISPEDEEAILELARDPFIFQNLRNSFAPSIYGYPTIKDSILYLLFGGVTKELSDVRIRGDINVLLVGDPGTGKSQLLQHAVRISPRGLFTTGRGSTAAGLTAAVVKEGGTGGFVLEAGALVLADKGLCAIDEFEKMREEDRGALHPAMEQQIVPIAKGGIVATLNARASILAAANPTLGRYNAYQTVAQNIPNLPVTLLSRFDLIFVIKDIPEPVLDDEIADHIIGLHMDGGTSAPSPINNELLRKYISYAKQIKPKITEAVREIFKTFYAKMRKSSIEGGENAAISITARQLESLFRIAEARARAHLHNEISAEDATAATIIMEKSLSQVGIDIETGQIDIDVLYSGKSRSVQDRMQKVLTVIVTMEKTRGAVRDDDLYEELLESNGMKRSDAAKVIKILMKDGTIYAPRPGYYKPISSRVVLPRPSVEKPTPKPMDDKNLQEEMDRVYSLVMDWRDGLHTDMVASELGITHNDALKLLNLLKRDGLVFQPPSPEGWWKAG